MFTTMSQIQLLLLFLFMHFHAAGCDGHNRATQGEYFSLLNGCQPFPSSSTEPVPLCCQDLLSSSEFCACNLVAKFVVSTHNINSLISKCRSLFNFCKANAQHISRQGKKKRNERQWFFNTSLMLGVRL